MTNYNTFQNSDSLNTVVSSPSAKSLEFLLPNVSNNNWKYLKLSPNVYIGSIQSCYKF